MKPIAAPATWPYPGHRTMAEVIHDEERAAWYEARREKRRAIYGTGRGRA